MTVAGCCGSGGSAWGCSRSRCSRCSAGWRSSRATPPPAIASRLEAASSEQTLRARRGAILDRLGRPLATTEPATLLFVDPQLIADHNTFSERVGYALGLDPVAIEITLSEAPTGSRYVVLDRELDEETAKGAEALALPGLYTQTELVRRYPQGPLAGQLLGFVGRDGFGLEGIERTRQAALDGQPGSVGVLRDARRRPLWAQNDRYQPQTDGQTVRLTIDATIQQIAEEELAATVEQFGAESGQLLVMDPWTGDVLASASVPVFDPSRFGESKPEDRRHRAVTDTYEPGSTFKPLVWAGLTQANAADLHEIIDCTEGGLWVTPYGRRLRDAHGLGELSWEGVLVESSNIGMAKVAERVSQARLREIVTGFGIGQPTGSGLPGEVGGLLHPLKDWTKYSQSSIPMGQEVATTPLQMVRAFSVFANGGRLVTPRVIEDGATWTPPQRQVISPQVAELTRRVLRRVVTEGTGSKADSELYELWGKTGTAQIPDLVRGGYEENQFVSSFLAGVPTREPRLIIGCFVHRPDRAKGHYGGTVAAPAVRRVAERALVYLGVPTDGDAALPLAGVRGSGTGDRVPLAAH